MRIACNLLGFAAGLLLGTAALHRSLAVLPSQTAGMLEHLAAYGDEYDVIVVGSSLSKINFVPAEFDARMAELGHPLRSFSLGMKSMRGGELHYYVQRVLELPLRRLRGLIVDVSLDQDLLLNSDDGYMRRTIEWHRPRQWWLSVQQVLASSAPWPRRLDAVVQHCRYLFMNVANVGMGLEALRSGAWWDPPPRVKPRGALVAGPHVARGQQWKVDRYQLGRAHHEQLRRALKYQRRVREPPKSPAVERAIRELARARGVPVTFLLSPMLYDARFDPAVAGDEPLRVIDLDSPSEYPDLYASEVRYDDLHLSYPGAVLYTRAIADAFARQLAPEQARK